MPTEEEKRLRRCCFSGHRPEKLADTPEAIQSWLSGRIDEAIADGYRTFITGCGMGVDLWAGQIILRKKADHPDLKLIAAPPWPGFSARWTGEWKAQYDALLSGADLVVPVSKTYSQDVFRKRNRWIVDHSSRMIACYNGDPGGTRDMIFYAEDKGLTVTLLVIRGNAGRGKETEPVRYPSDRKEPYPLNLLAALDPESVLPLNADQQKGLDYALAMLPERERTILELRFQKGISLRDAGDALGISGERIRQLQNKALRMLRYPKRSTWYRDGFEKAELAMKLECAGKIRKNLQKHLEDHPLACEEDIVKFVFQGMLGVGHLVESEEAALGALREEMDRIQPDEAEKLVEPLSNVWIRLNLRAAKARGITPEQIAFWMFRSTRELSTGFTRQNVWNFCMKLEGIDTGKMQAAAEKVTDDSWLPSHSEAYRQAYHPAYRVVHQNYRKFRKDEEED